MALSSSLRRLLAGALGDLGAANELADAVEACPTLAGDNSFTGGNDLARISAARAEPLRVCDCALSAGWGNLAPGERPPGTPAGATVVKTLQGLLKEDP